LPIIDYHCHLSPKDIAENRTFSDLTAAWLEGDHYKWRAMRTHGIAETYITGEASAYEKFEKWAETVPYTLRNPLFHWTHLELQRYFGIKELLNPGNARDIYAQANAQLQEPGLSVQGILKRMQVEVVCSTDDPTDDLSFHQAAQEQGLSTAVYPTFRPDRALMVDDPEEINGYFDQLSEVCAAPVDHFIDLLDALKRRMDFFHQLGCRLSDHGLEYLPSVDFEDEEVNQIFHKIRLRHRLMPGEIAKYQSSLLYHLGLMYHEHGWTMQFHLGALRNNNSRLLKQVGKDAGVDSIGDFAQGQSLARYLDRLDQTNQLPRTILYNLNPRDNEVFASMVGNFNDGSIAGKVQYGSAWWFLDQKDGMEKQINALSNMGLLSHFIGMLTDSRSFLSFPRHEYFRRILCNLIGAEVERGEIPAEMDWLGEMVSHICYHNARNYFGFGETAS
ncbi:MAG: glucuronate isomerase, partial [Bacteroidota bacterium]